MNGTVDASGRALLGIGLPLSLELRINYQAKELTLHTPRC